MTHVFPVLQRELGQAARAPSTYYLRTIWAGVCTVIGFGQVLAAFYSILNPSQLPRTLILTLGGLCALYALLGGAAATADSISEEKRADTLGLLFITRLNYFDIVLAKLFPSFLAQAGHLIAVLPVPAMTLLLGGVSFSDMTVVFLACLNLLFYGCAMGILASALNRNAPPATLLALGLSLLPIAFLYLAPDAPRVPAAPAAATTGWSAYAFSLPKALHLVVPATTWSGFLALHATLHLASWIALVLAALWLPFSLRGFPFPWRGRVRFLPFDPWSDPIPTPTVKPPLPAWFDDSNPLLQSHFHQRGRSLQRLTLGYAVASLAVAILAHALSDAKLIAAIAALLAAGSLGHFFLQLYAGLQSHRSLAEDRESGALEILLSCPIDPQTITRGKALLLKRRLTVPFLILTALQVSALALSFAGDPTAQGGLLWPVELLLGSLSLLFLIVVQLCQYHVLICHGALRAIRSTSTRHGAASTIGLALALIPIQLMATALVGVSFLGPTEARGTGPFGCLVLALLSVFPAVEYHFHAARTLGDQLRGILNGTLDPTGKPIPQIPPNRPTRKPPFFTLRFNTRVS